MGYYLEWDGWYGMCSRELSEVWSRLTISIGP